MDPLEGLIDHLRHTTPLSEGEASRVVAEVLSYFSEDLTAFVRRRHAELKSQAFTNEEVFVQVRAEIAARRFTVPQISLRQLRRIIYG